MSVTMELIALTVADGDATEIDGLVLGETEVLMEIVALTVADGETLLDTVADGEADGSSVGCTVGVGRKVPMITFLHCFPLNRHSY